MEFGNRRQGKIRGRPIPRDFEERWPEIGWTGAEAEWRAHPRSIVRWLDQCGRERMIARRKEFVAAQRKLRDRARRKGYRLT